jgi:hypothetical protein
MGGMDEDTAADMIAFADEESSRLEKEARFGKPREAAQAATAAPLPAPQQAEAQTEASKGRQAFENLFSQPAPTGEQEPASEEQPEAVAPAEEEIAVMESGEAVSEPATVAEDLVQGPVQAEEEAAIPATATPNEPAELAEQPPQA